MTFWLIYPLAFFRCFMSNSGVHTQSWTEPFIWTAGIDCSNSVSHDWDLQPPDDFTWKHLPTKHLILCTMCPCQTIQSEFLGLINLMTTLFCQVKLLTEYNMTKNCIYSIPCCCSRVYKGKTCHSLKRKARGTLKSSMLGRNLKVEYGRPYMKGKVKPSALVRSS